MSLPAQISNFSVFKVTVYHQTSEAPPVLPDFPDAYYLGAQLGTSDSSGYTAVYVIDPNGNTNLLNQVTPSYFDFGSPYFSDQTDFDDAYPSGTYDFYVADSSSTNTDSVYPPATDLYSASIAAFGTNCWNAMQQVDPAQDFTLTWNPFVAASDATSAFSFVDVFDETTGNVPFGADFLDPSVSATNIPANTLLYGKVYRVNAYFSNREDNLAFSFAGALATFGFDNLTYTRLATIAPWLRGDRVSTNLQLTWPTLALNFVLETSSTLSPDTGWSTVTNLPSASGGTNSLLLPAVDPSRFFRLRSI